LYGGGSEVRVIGTGDWGLETRDRCNDFRELDLGQSEVFQFEKPGMSRGKFRNCP